MRRSYFDYKNIFKNCPLPFAFIDLDMLYKNIEQLKTRIQNGKTIRVASKSIRSVDVLKRIIDSDKKLFQGVMCFSLGEAVYLCQKGFDDLLVAYPCLQENYIKEVCFEIKKGKAITLMVDCKKHVDVIQLIAARESVTVPVCIDIDMSSDFPALHFGVWRSALFNKEQVLGLVNYIKTCSNIFLDGLMGYEAQIAGVGDNVKGQSLKNSIIRLLKKISQKEIHIRREEIVKALTLKGIKLRFVNGGGTGSIEQTCSEKVVTEIAVGSAFFSPTLFDSYKKFKHLPAAGFALEIVRNPKPGIYTCHGGGYIASGSSGKEKLPSPYLPHEIRLFENEGAGEVQTPFSYQGTETLTLGDPVFMRHAKAGELCERFNELLLVSNGNIVGKALTYRGDGKCFL